MAERVESGVVSRDSELHNVGTLPSASFTVREQQSLRVFLPVRREAGPNDFPGLLGYGDFTVTPSLDAKRRASASRDSLTAP